VWLIEKLPGQNRGVIFVLSASEGVGAVNKGADILPVVLHGLTVGVEELSVMACSQNLVYIPLDAAKLRLKVG